MGLSDEAKLLENEDCDEENASSAWADAISKVLVKQGPKDAESLILAKAKLPEDDDIESVEKRERRRRLNKKRKWENMNYVKPSVLEKDYERSLQRNATRGVIQLFNAVWKHQKEIDEKLKTANTELKKEKVIDSVDKGKFLDLLKEDKMRKTEEEEAKPAWKVLQDDFMLGNNMKDWDKRSDDGDGEILSAQDDEAEV